jgi:hypothetical protein
MIWVVTFTATVSLNVMQGLAVSVGFALLTTVFRIQWPHWFVPITYIILLFNNFTHIIIIKICIKMIKK